MLGSTTSSILSNAANDALTGAVIGGPIGAAVGGVTFAIQSIAGLIDSNGPKKVAATDCANNTQFACEALVREWNNYPANMKTKALQVQYLNASLELWKYLEQCCNRPELGSAGNRCISERDHGGKYDYWPGCYDAIANDPQVYDPNTIQPLIQPIVQGNQVVNPTTVVNTATGTTVPQFNLRLSNPIVELGIAGLVLLLIL